jgi:hypothetical protein
MHETIIVFLSFAIYPRQIIFHTLLFIIEGKPNSLIYIEHLNQIDCQISFNNYHSNFNNAYNK